METSELIKEARRGSSAAQKYLFDQWAEKMHIICRRYVKSPEDAEELMLDGFYKFFKKINSFSYKGDAALYMWLKKLMINECLIFLRKKNVFSIVTEAAALETPLQEDALDKLSATEIFNLIVQLPARKDLSFSAVFSLGCLIDRNGDYFEKNTFRFGAGKLSVAKTTIEPSLYFNNFFKGSNARNPYQSILLEG